MTSPGRGAWCTTRTPTNDVVCAGFAAGFAVMYRRSNDFASIDMIWPTQHQPIDDSEHRRVGTDAESKRRDETNSKERLASQAAKRHDDVLNETIDAITPIASPARASPDADQFRSHFADVAEPRACGSFGFPARHAGRDELVDPHLKVERHLVVDIVSHRSTPKLARATPYGLDHRRLG